MANTAERKKKKDVDMAELGKELLNFAQENSSENMELNIAKARKVLGHYRNVLLEAYAFGPEELKKYKIVEGKTAAPLKEVEPPCLSGKGTITIKKFYVDEYNKQNPSNQLVKDDSFEVTIEGEKIVLTRI